ncbi:hypothetical protein BI375_07980 [Vibrio rotiferianus]|uniref:Uncharacterized protein n=1 Tax=Vibrio rotiferianus TaxID=190895 RepID=A0ABX3D6I5_9VIBR|nr:hypothetical protein [Vibrio rotiferianus]OHY90330.1 hypothetical protein BI375_07980 [Vibrio rotiferianus]
MTTYNITSNGNGDAFGGNKITNNDVFIQTLQLQITDTVTLNTISRPLVDALQEYRENKVVSALGKLDLLSQLGGLNDEALLAIASLRVLLNNEAQREDELCVEGYSKNQNLSLFATELAEAAILKLIELRNGVDAAHKRFQSLPEMVIPQYVYLQRLATQDYICELAERKYELSDFILSALFEKTLELSMIPEAVEILEQIQQLKPLGDFKRETVILECVNSNDLINKDYYCLSSEEKVKFDHLRDSLIELVTSSERPDFKLLNILAQLYHFTQYTCSVINNCLSLNKEHLETRNYFDNEVLRSILTQAALKEIDKLKALEPEELMLKLINQTESDFCNFPVCRLLFESGDIDLIVGTLHRLSEQDSISAKANLLALAAISCPILSAQDFPYTEIDNIIKNISKNTSLNVSFIQMIAPELALHGYPELAVCFYQSAFGEQQPWLSEPYFSYLNFLYQARQYNTLSKSLDGLTEKEKQQQEVVTLYSLLANNAKDYELAASLLRRNIDQYKEWDDLSAHEKRNLVYLWGQYLEAIHQEDPLKAQELTEDLPSKIFSEFFGDYSWRLMFYHTHRLKDVAEKIIDWFCDDPEANAKPYFNLIMNATQNYEDQVFPLSCGKYKGAYTYIENRTVHNKLAVSRLFVNKCPRFLIDVSGDIARRLNSAKVGEPVLIQVQMCTVAEKKSPIIAIYHIASEIMDKDHDEVFHKLELPENATGEEILAAIEKFMAPFNESRERLKPIMKQNLPIDMKYRHINGHDNIQNALLAVLSPDVHIHCTDNLGDDKETGCLDFVIDEMTAVYLASIGNVFENCKWHMTEAVYNSLSQYCKTYRGKKPVYNKAHYTVYFEEESGEDCLPTDFISNLSKIIERTTSHSDVNLDIALGLKTKLRGLCTENFLLSLALAENLVIGLFCIDSGTRGTLKALNHSSIPLKPDTFSKEIISNTNSDILNNLLWLNLHSNFSSIAFASLEALILLIQDEKLNMLVKFLEKNTENTWDRSSKLYLLRSCLNHIVIARLHSLKTDAAESILLNLLISLTTREAITSGDVYNLVELLPVPLLLEHYEQSDMFSEMADVRRELIVVTDIYVNSITRAVRKNNFSIEDFWKIFASLCV